MQYKILYWRIAHCHGIYLSVKHRVLKHFFKFCKIPLYVNAVRLGIPFILIDIPGLKLAYCCFLG